MNIVLCGMMGCGKTTVALALQRLYGYEVIDTDALIVQRYGEINKIFAEYGEEYFRNLETRTVKEVASAHDGAVISLGGGCVLRAENVESLKKTGKLIYLRTREDTLIARLKGDDTRPLLKDGLEKRVHDILAARSAVYEGVADEIIDTDGLSPEEIAKLIGEGAI